MSKDESVLPYTKVVVHPIVLLNVVDHYTRMSKIQSPDKRVVGILLGNVGFDGVVDVLNTYAVPFDEDESVWFFDHNYHETLAAMSLKVNRKYIVITCVVIYFIKLINFISLCFNLNLIYMYSILILI